MNTLGNLSKILKIGAYIALMFISTWATVESAHNSFPGWPIVILWIGALAFFSIAALGAKLIIKSFDKSERINGRVYYLLGGMLLLIIFWICVILPTNTHTIFYKKVVQEIAIKEIKDTETKLENIILQGEQIVKDQLEKLEKEVRLEIINYRHEIFNMQNPGAGQRAEEILGRIENKLGDVQIQRLTLRTRRQRDLIEYANQMETLIEAQLNIVLKNKYKAEIERLKKNIDVNEINTLITKLKEEERYLDIHHEPSSATITRLHNSFSMINRYQPRIENDKNNSKILTKPKTYMLQDVFYVWKNFFKGVYKDMGFVYSIIVAFVIDIAGFIFFILAFKSED